MSAMYGETTVNINIKDTSGHLKHRQAIKEQYKVNDVVIIVYDVGSRWSFDGVPFWLRNVRTEQQVSNLGNDSECLYYIVGNKVDEGMPKSRRQVRRKKVKKFIKTFQDDYTTNLPL